MIRINQIKINVCPEEEKREHICKKISSVIRDNNFKLKKIVKESIDARDKEALKYIYCVDIEASDEDKLLRRLKNNKNVSDISQQEYIFPVKNSCDVNKMNYKSPVIIGAGPAGYVCALWLARNGYRPIVIERGRGVDQRSIDVERFWQHGTINPNSNISFGEGGAGTFSDGKLTTGIKDRQYRIKQLLKDLIGFGADEAIAYVNKPHIGTDVLKTVMKNMRMEIIKLGGMVWFDSIFKDVISDGEVKSILVDVTGNVELDGMLKSINNKWKYRYEGKRVYLELETDVLVLAIGHSSRDTFVTLNDRKIPMEAKAFAMGLRIEHEASLINRSQYGTSQEASYLPAASYKMTYRSSEGRSVYSFCMCPGGYVVNAASDTEQAVVNGMSYSDRGGSNSNSAIVVNVTPDDFVAEGFGDKGVLSGMYYQMKYEKKAYEEGKSYIPVQLYKDLKGEAISSDFGRIKPCIKGNYSMGRLNNCLPPYIIDAIIEAIEYYDTKLHGFADDEAVLSGIESRTSSPVRILRDENYMSSISGIFPCGEGAGYAGGITSAAVDGMKVAEAWAMYLNDINNR